MAEDGLNAFACNGSVHAMFAVALKHLFLALAVLAFFGSATTQAMLFSHAMGMSSTADGMMVAGDCDQMDMMGSKSAINKSMPCKSMSLDCLQLIACSGSTVNLAANSYAVSEPVAYGAVNYWPPSVMGMGFSVPPDPFPPKTLT
ncbi:MAG: hypothetical protein AB1781_08720 [Pseudomonadota bacterium]